MAATDKKGSEKSEKREKDGTGEQNRRREYGSTEDDSAGYHSEIGYGAFGSGRWHGKRNLEKRKRIMGFQTEVPFTICLQRILFLIYIA